MAVAKNTKAKTRVFLVDDHPIVRQGLAQLINHEQDLMVCGEAEDARTTLDLLPEAKPGLVIVDISLRGMDGLELIKSIKSRHVRLPTLVVSMHDESLYAERALRAGAMGYIMKQEGMEKMIVAVRRVLEGRIYLSEDMDSRVLQKMMGTSPSPTVKPASALESLSDRELEIFGLLGRGYGSRQIAEVLYLSIKTVDSYRANIKTKMQFKNSIELLQHATQWVDLAKAAK
jgi:DNA-binding NarL/FixJ family response regulator